MMKKKIEVYHSIINRSRVPVVVETKLRHTKIFTGLQGFVPFDNG